MKQNISELSCLNQKFQAPKIKKKREQLFPDPLLAYIAKHESECEATMHKLFKRDNHMLSTQNTISVGFSEGKRSQSTVDESTMKPKRFSFYGPNKNSKQNDVRKQLFNDLHLSSMSQQKESITKTEFNKTSQFITAFVKEIPQPIECDLTPKASIHRFKRNTQVEFGSNSLDNHVVQYTFQSRQNVPWIQNTEESGPLDFFETQTHITDFQFMGKNNNNLNVTSSELTTNKQLMSFNHNSQIEQLSEVKPLRFGNPKIERSMFDYNHSDLRQIIQKKLHGKQGKIFDQESKSPLKGINPLSRRLSPLLHSKKERSPHSGISDIQPPHPSLQRLENQKLSNNFNTHKHSHTEHQTHIIDFDQAEKRIKTYVSDDEEEPISKIRRLTYDQIDDVLMKKFNNQAKKYALASPDTFMQEYDKDQLFKALCQVQEPFLSRLRCKKNERMGKKLSELEQVDLENFLKGTELNVVKDDQLLDEDVLKAKLFMPLKVYGPKKKNLQRRLIQKTNSSGLKGKRANMLNLLGNQEIALNRLPVQTLTEEQIIVTSMVKLEKQRDRIRILEKVMQGSSPYAQNGMPTVKALTQVVNIKSKTQIGEKIKEITHNNPNIGQEELEALLLFRELKLGHYDQNPDWDLELQRQSNVLFLQKSYSNDVVNFFKKKNRYRSVMGALKIDRGRNHFENILLAEQVKMMTINEEIKEKLKYINMFKQDSGASINELHKDDAKFQYYVRCKQDLEIALPLLDKIFDKTLCLKNYRLSPGQCNALALACSLFDYSITRVHFDNCGIEDTQFSDILQGLSQLHDFKSIVSVNNKFEQKSLQHITPLFKKKIPQHLDELRLINCKSGKKIITQLLQQINQNCYLSKLALVQARLSEAACYTLIQFMQTSQTLNDLDLSYCEVNQNSWVKFFESLQSNRKLTSLNLSYNSLFDSNQDLIPNLTHFIKRNKILVHLNLSGTALKEQQLCQIGLALRRSCSLQGVHLSENPGICEQVIEQVRKNVHGLPHEEINKIKPDFKDIMSFEIAAQRPNALLDAEFINRMTEARRMNEIDVEMPTANKQPLILTRKLGLKKACPGLGQWKLLTRVEEECWICSQHILAMFIWTESIGQQENVNDFMFEDFYEQEIERINDSSIDDPNSPKKASKFFEINIDQRIKSNESETELRGKNRLLGWSSTKIDQEARPEIFGDFTNWKPNKMFKVEDFTNLIQAENHEQIVKILHEKRQIKNIGNALGNYFAMSAEEKKHYSTELAKQKRNQFKPWHQIVFDNIPYVNPVLVNGESYYNFSKLSNDEKVYVYLDFINPGRLFYSIKHQKEYILHRVLARHRQEKVPFYKRNKKQRNFIKMTSVFANFKDDLPETALKCYLNDKLIWKLGKIMKNNVDDFEMTQNQIRDDYAGLKEMYEHFRAMFGNIQGITSSGFKKLTHKLGILDDHRYKTQKDPNAIQLVPSDIDRFMIACNYEDRQTIAGPSIGGFQSTNEEIEQQVQRPQFVEMMVRTANYRYMQNGFAKTFKDAYSLLNKEILTPFMIKEFGFWHGWREKELYTIEIDDLLRTNMDLINKVWYKYSMEANQKKSNIINKKIGPNGILTIEDANRMIYDDANINISRSDIRQAFCLSKQTVVTDNEEKGLLMLQRMIQPEFLDFLGRVAVFKFLNSEMEDISLHDKLASVLDELFVVINETRRLEVFEADFSESDSDY